MKMKATRARHGGSKNKVEAKGWLLLTTGDEFQDILNGKLEVDIKEFLNIQYELYIKIFLS